MDSLPVCGFFFVCTGRDAKVCFDGQWDLKKKQTGGLQEGKGFVTIFRKAAVEESGRERQPMKVIEFIHIHQSDETDECECIIRPDGSVDEPLPSHINRLVDISGRELAWLHEQMSKGMEPLFWLVEFTGCLAVWKTRVVSPSKPTRAQLDTLEELRNGALLAPKYLMQTADEAYGESVRKAKEELSCRAYAP